MTTRIPDEADAPTRALLEWVIEAAPVPLRTLSAVEARREFNERRQKTDLDPIPLARVEDQTIPGPAGTIPVRLYASDAGTKPVLVYFHGGGFVLGDLDSHDAVCRRIAKGADCLLVAVDYRLAPEHPYPAAVEDAYAALDWVAENTAEIGGDPARIAIGGDSAGGNLAAAATQNARDKGGPALRLQALIYPATEAATITDSRRRFADVLPIDEKTIDWFYNHYYPDPSRVGEPAASPGLTTDLSGLPPAIVLTAGLDPLVDEGAAYADRLREAGVPVDYHCYPGTIHGYLGMGKMLPHAEDTIDRVAAALRTAFG